MPLPVGQLDIHLILLGVSPVGECCQEVPGCGTVPFAVSCCGTSNDFPQRLGSRFRCLCCLGLTHLGGQDLDCLTQAAHHIRQEYDGLCQVHSDEWSHLRGGWRGRRRHGAGSGISGGSCGSSQGAAGCGHSSSSHKTGKGSGGGIGIGCRSRKVRRPRRSHRYHTSCVRSITSGATGTSGVTTLYSARQNRSRMLRTVGRSSGTDSCSVDKMDRLGRTDADFRRGWIGFQGRRLFATSLSMVATSCYRSVASGIRRGTLASSRCWSRSHSI